MLIRKKHSTKELLKQINTLEKKNETLTSKLSNSSSLDEKLENISLFFSTDVIDIIIVRLKDDIINLLDLSIPLNVLAYIPKSPEELFNLISPDDQPIIFDAIQKLGIGNTTKYQTKLHLQRDDGKVIKPVELIVICKNSDEYIIAIKDIAEISRQKRELEKTKEKVEESDKLKATLLSNISHQIRTPLNSITGFSELIAGSEIDRPKRKEYIEIIKRQSKRILNLIDDISEITKLESGAINISKTSCNLNLLLNELLLGLNQQRTNLRKDLVDIELKLPTTDNYDILTDSGRLQQALLNIVNYSLRHTQQGKIVIGFNFNTGTQKIDFFIKDTSAGLSKEEQKVIFNRFMVVENSETTKFDDPGLGLTIARETIRALGGKIWVESEVGKGTSFLFTIPLEKVVNSEPEVLLPEEEVLVEENYNWANKVILIVDDEDVNAMFLDAVFQITGVQLLFAKNGLQAVELVKNINKIDLILMDIKMPVMNGIKATKEIRKINQTIPIIAQTALASEEDKTATLHAGCNNAITKPIEVIQILQMVNHYLGE